jgi:hypothetical protein
MTNRVCESQRGAARIANGGSASHQAKRPEPGETFGGAITTEENEFSTPNSPIFPVAGAVPCNAEDLISGMLVFQQAGEDVSEMMLDGEAWETLPLRITRRGIVWMFIMNNRGKLCPVQLGQGRDRVRKHRLRGKIF